MLTGRCSRSRLDLLKPHTADKVEQKQMELKVQHDRKARGRSFGGDKVLVRNFHQGERWLSGVIKKRTGPVSFLNTDGRYRRCHQDQLRKRCVNVDTSRDIDIVQLELTFTCQAQKFQSPTQNLTFQ